MSPSTTYPSQSNKNTIIAFVHSFLDEYWTLKPLFGCIQRSPPQRIAFFLVFERQRNPVDHIPDKFLKEWVLINSLGNNSKQTINS